MIFAVFTLISYMLLGVVAPLLTEFELSFIAPDLAVGVLLATSAYFSNLRFVFFALILGTLMDGFYPLSPMGLHMERVVILAYATRTLTGLIPARSVSRRIMIGMLLCAISDFILFLLLAIFDQSFTAYGVIFRRMLPHAIVTGITVPVLDVIFKFAGRRLTFRKERIFFP
jgi:cell shape-determining protein MreD